MSKMLQYIYLIVNPRMMNLIETVQCCHLGIKTWKCSVYNVLSKIKLQEKICGRWIGYKCFMTTVLETAGVPVTGGPPIFEFIIDWIYSNISKWDSLKQPQIVYCLIIITGAVHLSSNDFTTFLNPFFPMTLGHWPWPWARYIIITSNT